MTEQPSEFVKINLDVNRKMHMLMKEYAKRKRIKLGLAYDQAMQTFLMQPKNYMGEKRSNQLKGR